MARSIDILGHSSGRTLARGTQLRLSRATLLALCACFATSGYIAASIAPFAALPSIMHSGAYEPGAPDAKLYAPARRLQRAAAAAADAAGSTHAAASESLARIRPPLTPGTSGEAGYRVVPFQILSWHPRIVLLPGFLSDERCARIVNTTKAKGLSKSPVSAEPLSSGGAAPSGAADDQQEIRTSTGVFMDSSEDPNGDLKFLEDKIAAVTLLPASHGEVCVRAAWVVWRSCVWFGQLTGRIWLLVRGRDILPEGPAALTRAASLNIAIIITTHLPTPTITM